MYELTSKCGLKVLATYVDNIGWFDFEGYQLKDNIWISVEKIN